MTRVLNPAHSCTSNTRLASAVAAHRVCRLDLYCEQCESNKGKRPFAEWFIPEITTSIEILERSRDLSALLIHCHESVGLLWQSPERSTPLVVQAPSKISGEYIVPTFHYFTEPFCWPSVRLYSPWPEGFERASSASTNCRFALLGCSFVWCYPPIRRRPFPSGLKQSRTAVCHQRAISTTTNCSFRSTFVCCLHNCCQ